MECRKCRGAIPDGSRFCALCGAEQNPVAKRKALKRANGTAPYTRWPAAENAHGSS